MAHDYDLYEELGSLNTLLGAYHDWFFNVLNCALYAKDNAGPAISPIPGLFVETLGSMIVETDGEVQEVDIVRKLEAQHHELEACAKDIYNTGTLNPAKFDEFTNLFKTFISGIQKSCQNLILEEWGLDVLTGLKNSRIMVQELSQEMERLSRHGLSFSLVLARIDDFQELKKTLGQAEADRYLKMIASFIRRSLRSFDTAYRFDGHHFVMALKQADLLGGKKAIERLGDQLEKSGIKYEVAGEKRMLTMSCCVSEPLPDDKILKLLEDLGKDLDTQAKEFGVVLTYHEVSPLQRFIQTGQKNT
ncbi:MAG: diguanylate cyclase [Alphaproteobacteria bacterium]|nr:diguanylate cyclase [Alphaproteobacteria bacterium]